MSRPHHQPAKVGVSWVPMDASAPFVGGFGSSAGSPSASVSVSSNSSTYIPGSPWRRIPRRTARSTRLCDLVS